MLSIPTGLNARQRQHRRQNSTPTAFEGVKIPNLPSTAQRQAAGHRRGLSLDIRRHHNAAASPSARQQTYMHHVLREAQQQRIQARPGTQQNPYATLTPSGSENYLISPHGTPQAQRFDPSCFDPNNIPYDPYSGDLNVMMGKGQAVYGDNLSGGKDFDLFNNDSALSTPTFMNFQDSPSAQGWASEGDTSSTRRTSRRISNGILDRVSKFETLDGGLQRPITPPNTNSQNYYPPSPMETPQDRLVKHEPPSRFQDGYDESMEETIKPVRSRGSNRRAQTIFQDMRQQSESSAASPATSNPMPEPEAYNSMPLQTPDYLNMNNFNSEFMKIENTFDRDQVEAHGLSMNQHMSQHASPENSQMAQYMTAFDNKTDLRPYPLTAQALSAHPSQSSPHRENAHRRTESLASIASAASIASINIEETKTDTGVTLEEISQYIRGPDAGDGKWVCQFDDCGKKFGRKENIKSHVQTHLNDRQYQCPTCQKCFVRQHDLKRHAKIHTGIKPYPCECGNSFARHDALTRHRQRGMCIGAFDGIVRKVVKRGRPKKNRPDMDSRMEKSARTRKKNMSVSSMSSFSGYSDSSAANSPENDYNMLDDMMDMGMGAQPQTHNLASVSSAPMTSAAPPAINDMASSPSAVSAHSYVSPEAIMDGTPVNTGSPAKSVASQYNTPPELSQSSSPPPTRFFDVDPNSSLNTDDLSSLSGTSALMAATSSMSGTLPLGMSDHDDDMLLQFTNDDGLVQLDRDPSMLMMSKFDEEFDNAVGMFTNNDDVFFGST
ncbi:Metallothionein expression activator [Neonectria punicea]|uniref:Metallothionein expression activator n=1 Tax=Neonectria punicea TaxID=979145 RepID=A0ABR1GK00_9HYPO